MSLLGVYVIVGYYQDAEENLRNTNKPKITNQVFDSKYIKEKIKELKSYQSDPLHWNLNQLENVSEPGERAIVNYSKIEKKLGCITMD